VKILMVSDFYPPFLGGVEVHVRSLSRELVARGHDVVVATLAAPGLPPTEIDEGVRVHRIRSATQRLAGLFASADRPWAPPAPDPGATVALRRLIAAERPDVIHGHDWLARSVLPASGRPLVMSLHYFTLSCPKKNLMRHGAPCAGPSLLRCPSCAARHYGTAKAAGVVVAHRAFARIEARRVDHFLPVSQATAAGNGLDLAGLPYTVVPNFVSDARALGDGAALLDSLPAEPFLLFVGDVRRDKGAEVLLDAYAQMHDPPALVLIGEQWPDAPAVLPAGAVLMGRWPNEVVRAAMARALALVVPSVWPEPFGIVVAESLAAGRPVVASAAGGIPEIVRDGAEALLVPPSDAPALTAALERVSGDDGLRDRLAAGAVRRAADFTAASVVPRFEAVYDAVARP